MSQMINLCDGVDAVYIKSSKFKTTRISVTFFVPLDKNTISQNTLLPALLSTSSANYPNYRKLQLGLAALYGASVSASSGKVGDALMISLSINGVDDKFLDTNESVAQKYAGLLSDMIFRPNLDESGNFIDTDIAREKRLLCESIQGELNNKRLYALLHAEEELFRDEVYGTPHYGTAKGAMAVSAEDIKAAWEYIQKSAYARVSVVSSTDPAPIFDVFKSEFGKIERTAIRPTAVNLLAARDSVIDTGETIDVTQGKMVLMFTTEQGGGYKNSAALFIMCDLFGGGPYSRLFLNVREKLSLCYYCAARVNRYKGILTVDSGVERENAQPAKQEILRQLDIVKQGDFTDADLETSKRAKIDQIRTLDDFAAELEGFYVAQLFDESITTPSEFIKAIADVTKKDVIKAAQGINLALTYMLTPEKGEDKSE